MTRLTRLAAGMLGAAMLGGLAVTGTASAAPATPHSTTGWQVSAAPAVSQVAGSHTGADVQAAVPRPRPKLAKVALSYVGKLAKKACDDAGIRDLPHYQCKTFVSCVSKLAFNKRLAGDYYWIYKKRGYVKVSKAQARRGDIIQLNKRSDRGSYYSGMHTAIMNSSFEGNNVTVIDSNYGGDSLGKEKVRKHHWNPYKRARTYGLEVNIWRYAGK